MPLKKCPCCRRPIFPARALVARLHGEKKLHCSRCRHLLVDNLDRYDYVWMYSPLYAVLIMWTADWIFEAFGVQVSIFGEVLLVSFMYFMITLALYYLSIRLRKCERRAAG